MLGRPALTCHLVAQIPGEVAGGAEADGDWDENRLHDVPTLYPGEVEILARPARVRKLRRFQPVKALLAGESELVQILGAALRAEGVEAEIYAGETGEGPRPVARHLVELEHLLTSSSCTVAVSADASDAALALGITALKVGVTFCAFPETGEDRAAERRILAALSELDLAGDPKSAAEVIAERLRSAPDSV